MLAVLRRQVRGEACGTVRRICTRHGGSNELWRPNVTNIDAFRELGRAQDSQYTAIGPGVGGGASNKIHLRTINDFWRLASLGEADPPAWVDVVKLGK